MGTAIVVSNGNWDRSSGYVSNEDGSTMMDVALYIASQGLRTQGAHVKLAIFYRYFSIVSIIELDNLSQAPHDKVVAVFPFDGGSEDARLNVVTGIPVLPFDFEYSVYNGTGSLIAGGSNIEFRLYRPEVFYA